jgi:hypothetical protein
LGLSTVVIAMIGCGGSSPPPQVKLVPEGTMPKGGKEAPEWVMRTPRLKGNVCAVGAVDPTFYRQDGLTQSAEAARSELARTVQVKISSVMLDEQTVRGTHVEQSVIQEVIGSISDVVLSGAQVMEYWYDDNGSVSRRGMTYALACMATDQSAAELAEKLKNVMPEGEDKEKKIADVRARAAAAFDELEQMEAKKRGENPSVPEPEAPPIAP